MGLLPRPKNKLNSYELCGLSADIWIGVDYPLHLAMCRIAIQCLYIMIIGFQAILELRIADKILEEYVLV